MTGVACLTVVRRLVGRLQREPVSEACERAAAAVRPALLSDEAFCVRNAVDEALKRLLVLHTVHVFPWFRVVQSAEGRTQRI